MSSILKSRSLIRVVVQMSRIDEGKQEYRFPQLRRPTKTKADQAQEQELRSWWQTSYQQFR